MTKNEIGYFLTALTNASENPSDKPFDFNKETTLEPVAQIILTSNECLYCDGATKFTFITLDDGTDGYLQVYHEGFFRESKLVKTGLSGGKLVNIQFFEIVGFQLKNETQRKQSYLFGGTN